ncbi:Probable LIM domain-containing serine/threonine-protein kinase DDB [Seminavis robusta]|uniref:Probable LIM domain-containing serine/threonine-protein kinase DDB n=1 Tax=Seminavis robusta TaxID=568900 RepID=A0A9N8E294_9STRA|nr:Probable LIM domain-containing serine/threonine-protein kinase DDB [Seminavis robusta]|eukprot:Sro434_g142030.1 Probable LIM domain-containing serine/threonine-protein kinase DDB (451) ;mRNA; r:23419-24771
MRPTWIQTYVERQTASVINEQVEKRSKKMEFLHSDNSRGSSQIALFQRREVQTGSLLGQGNFSDVYEVTRFKLLRSGPASQSPIAEDARLACCWNAKKVSSSCKYVIKLPKKPERRGFLGSSRRSQDGSRNNNRFPEYTKASIDLILEGKFLSALDHKHIIKVRGLSCGPSPFIIMDRLESTLAERLEQWRAADSSINHALILKEKTNYALQMADAIDYLHQRRLIVRDFKPANTGFKRGLNGVDQVQLFDFGLCRELPQSLYFEAKDEDQIFRMSMAGTLRYMSVEQVNTGFYGLKSDVYSWAVVVFEMMTLEVPYANICNNQAMHRRYVCQGGERPEFPKDSQVPACIQELICEGWSQEIKNRPTMKSVCSRLEEIIDHDLSFPSKESRPQKTVSVSQQDMDTLIAAAAACNKPMSTVNRNHHKRPSVTSAASANPKRRCSMNAAYLL